MNSVIQKSDVVIVCTPHNEHTQIVKETQKQGKICIVEKPLCITSADFSTDFISQTQNIYIVFQNRYNDAVREAKKYIEKGTI